MVKPSTQPFSLDLCNISQTYLALGVNFIGNTESPPSHTSAGSSSSYFYLLRYFQGYLRGEGISPILSTLVFCTLDSKIVSLRVLWGGTVHPCRVLLMHDIQFNRSSTFYSGFGFQHGCLLALTLFLACMDRISMCRVKGKRVYGLGILEVICTDYLALLASSCCDLKHSVGQLAVEFSAAGIRVSACKSDSTVLCWITLDCSLQVKNDSQLKDFENLRAMLTSEGTGKRMEREIDRQHPQRC